MACLNSRITITLLIAAALSQSGCCRSLLLKNNGCDNRCESCDACGKKCCAWSAWLHPRSLGIPETYPLGSMVRAHYHTMETNGEAADFILYRHEFVASTGELTPDGKDHILEIAARMRSVPFPVIVERSENNADPELDAHRRSIVACILGDLGNPDAQQRTFVAPSYGPGKVALESEPEYYRHIYSGIGNQDGGYGNGFGQFGQVGAFGGGFGTGAGALVGFAN